MSGMQATIEASVEFHHFYNVDLFQRGFYQIRSYIKSSSKLPMKFEVSFPSNQIENEIFPASIINGVAVTRTIQIMYRNEEVPLNDIVQFKIHAIVENGKIEESLSKADLTLHLELWYTETDADMMQEGFSRHQSEEDSEDSSTKSRRGSVTNGPFSTIECVSSRTLKLNFQPCRGLHYHLPVLFDYFHMAAVTTTIHMVLLSIHQPYITFVNDGSLELVSTNGPPPATSSSTSKVRKNTAKNTRLSQPTLETILFGGNMSTKKESGNRMSRARKIHSEVCSLLLASLESLQLSFIQLSAFLVDQQTRDQSKFAVEGCQRRLNSLSDLAKDCRFTLGRTTSCCGNGKDRKSVPLTTNEISERWERSRWYLAIDSEEEFVALANNDISQLCGELILMWNNFLSVCTRKANIKSHLSRVHHLNRVKRFSEAFFVVQNPRSAALSCCESVYSQYENVSTMLRCSKYLMNLPNLPVSCTALDGDVTNLPIIFEDKYQEDHTPRICAASALIRSSTYGDPKAESRRHSCSHLPAENMLDRDSVDGLLSFSEVMALGRSESNGKKPQRPSSIPSAKKFNGEMVLQTDVDFIRLQQRLRALPENYTLPKFASDCQEQHLVPNHLDHEDEPSVLTSTSCLPNLKPDIKANNRNGVGGKPLPPNTIKGLRNGFSHLEWSSAIPYNLAEEPDIVQGIKHSHSCHSMPASEQEKHPGNPHLVTSCTESVPNLSSKSINSDNSDLESGCGTLDSIEEAVADTKESGDKITFDVTSRVGREVSGNLETTSSSDTSSSCGEESDISKSPRVNFQDVDLGIHSSSSSPSEPANSLAPDKLVTSTSYVNDQTERSGLTLLEPTEKSAIVANHTESVISATISRETQEELTKKLEEFRQQSISINTSYTERPRAKSEEVISTFSGDLAFQPRIRLKSESANERDDPQVLNQKSLPIKVDSDLCSPILIQSIISGKLPVKEASSKPVKSDLLPPSQFQDSPKEQSEINASKATPEENQALREKLERKISSSRFTSSCDPIIHDTKITDEKDSKNGSETDLQPSSGTIPLRKRSQSRESDQNESGSLSRIDYKRQLQSPAIYTPRFQSNNQNSFRRNFSKQKVKASSPDDNPINSQPLVPVISDETVNFIKAKEEFKKSMNFNGALYSEFSRFPTTLPYFQHTETSRVSGRSNIHLVVCVHGLEGNSADLRLIKIYLEMALPGHNLDFLMSEINQSDTFLSFETMTDRLVNEIWLHRSSYAIEPERISFVGHSLGCILIRSAISRPEMARLTPKFHTFLSLSGPHLGTLYNNSGLVNMGLWFMQKWKKSGSLHQLALKDATDIRKTFMYQLSVRSNLHLFKNVLLVGSTQDRYVPWNSARIELCKAAVKDKSIIGSAYREMVDNILSPVVNNPDVNLIRYDIHHALPSNTTNTFIGRAAHIAVLDSELFLEKFIMISAIKYFI